MLHINNFYIFSDILLFCCIHKSIIIMPAQNTLQNANEHDHVELKTLAIVDPVGMEIDRS